MSKIMIGLEAHDGSGKSTTAKEISKIFNGTVFFTNKETKQKRNEIYTSAQLSHERKMLLIEETYIEEKQECEKQTNLSDFVILDRTWYSHTVEQNVIDALDRNVDFTYPDRMIPAHLLSPNLVFQILIPERERQKRVMGRGLDLSKRDKRLNNEKLYRERLELERKLAGCVPLRLRLRDESVCALRAAQVILGHESIPPMIPNLDF